ncbi:MAG: acyl-homoserine-lactone synthase [Phenylobacterium sp.]|uniref:acyl-homoserine-lactone synthase n=1 Tax=Phenylobacterium sp. TaxID=1871053 RepID=UPI00271ECC9B|nr:acyl-homoserine-lactone synthase [Phenylobacterium sp.]MDO8410402.1 acyl-homoserine-lactone synthase [Phenylobacterium sp.]
MIHVVTAGNRSLYRRELAMMHAQRAEVFIDQLGWPLQRDASGGESDPGDDDQAIYFLVLEADGALVASCRIRPTVGWSLLGGPAAHLAPDENLARRIDTWELSRILLLPPSQRSPGHVPPGEVRLAILEEAYERGVPRLVGLADGLMEEVLMRSGMAIGKLGPTGPFGASPAFAFEIGTGPAAIAALRQTLGIERARRLRLPNAPAGGDVRPQEVEAFLGVAARLDRRDLQALMAALRRAVAEEN